MCTRSIWLQIIQETGKSAWLLFKAVCLNFLGNVKAKNYKELVEDLLNSYQTMGCNMSLKSHFSHSRLDFFPSRPERSKRQKLGSIPPGYIHQWRKDMQESHHRTC